MSEPTLYPKETQMSHLQKLSTEKYVVEAQAHEAKLIRSEMARKSDRSIKLFCFAFIMFLLGMVCVLQMPNWMPAVGSWLEEIGLLTGQTAQVKWARRMAVVATRMQATGLLPW
jgi:hypothetical protein